MHSIFDCKVYKQQQKKICMLTCYDYTSARIINNTAVDCVLVGDSGGMVMCGHADTTQTTLAEMQFMTRAVARGLDNRLLIADLPFMSYRQSLAHTVKVVTRLVQCGAHAVKLEGSRGNVDTIAHLVEGGVPVMGHIGLTPQFIHGLGGYKVQGKTHEMAAALKQEAQALEQAGCFALVLECIPAPLAAEITALLAIPTIGIGAGPDTDGQVLVFHDLLGLQQEVAPKFVKTYHNGRVALVQAINQFCEEVTSGIFPGREHSYQGEQQP